MSGLRGAATGTAAALLGLRSGAPAAADGTPRTSLGRDQTTAAVESATRGPDGLRLVLTVANRGDETFVLDTASPYDGPEGFSGVAVVDPATGRMGTAFRVAECRCSKVPVFLQRGEAVTFTVDVADPGGSTVDVAFTGFQPITGVEVGGDDEPADDPEVSELRPRALQPAPRTKAGAVSRTGQQQVALDTDVLFAFGSAALTPAAGGDLDRAAALLRAQPARRVAVDGHTDSQGDPAFNLRLSQSRATTVRDALAARLGGGWTFDVRGYGETRPVAAETTDGGAPYAAGQARNRRVELRVED